MPFHWKHLYGNVYDVFVGNGWDNWSRIRVGRDYSSVIGGYRLQSSTMKEVVTSING